MIVSAGQDDPSLVRQGIALIEKRIGRIPAATETTLDRLAILQENYESQMEQHGFKVFFAEYSGAKSYTEMILHLGQTVGLLDEVENGKYPFGWGSGSGPEFVSVSVSDSDSNSNVEKTSSSLSKRRGHQFNKDET